MYMLIPDVKMLNQIFIHRYSNRINGHALLSSKSICIDRHVQEAV